MKFVRCKKGIVFTRMQWVLLTNVKFAAGKFNNNWLVNNLKISSKVNTYQQNSFHNRRT
jgi:hypothetical protein